jgi:hypothetical protein
MGLKPSEQVNYIPPKKIRIPNVFTVKTNKNAPVQVTDEMAVELEERNGSDRNYIID